MARIEPINIAKTGAKRMSRHKILAFFHQFPFVHNIRFGDDTYEEGKCGNATCAEMGWHRHYFFFEPGDITEVYVERIDQVFLCHVPVLDNIDNPGRRNEWIEAEVTAFIAADGTILHYVNEVADSSFVQEAVGEALLNLDDPDQVEYIFHATYIGEGNSEGQGPYYRAAVLKRPKRFTMREWIAEQARLAQEEIDRNLAKIDTE